MQRFLVQLAAVHVQFKDHVTVRYSPLQLTMRGQVSIAGVDSTGFNWQTLVIEIVSECIAINLYYRW